MIIDRMIIDKFLLFKNNEESLSFNEDFSPGFNAFIGCNGTEIPFDQTQIDILANAQLPETRE